MSNVKICLPGYMLVGRNKEEINHERHEPHEQSQTKNINIPFVLFVSIRG
jgi:hypothetical protein